MTFHADASIGMDGTYGSIASPLYLSTTFERDADGGYSGGYMYSRQDNPNRHRLECALASLEGGEDAAAFASGSAASVLHPWLPEHPGYDVARLQMAAGGALFSILVAGNAERAMRVAANVRVFKRATSFGGPDSLIEHRASVEAPGTQTPPNLLRLAIGLEEPQVLLDDLLQALR